MRKLATNWWDALGNKVNAGSFQAAADFCVECNIYDGNLQLIELGLNLVRHEIEHDNPERAYTQARSMFGRDETGVIRLLATMAAPSTEDMRQVRIEDLLDLKAEMPTPLLELLGEAT